LRIIEVKSENLVTLLIVFILVLNNFNDNLLFFLAMLESYGSCCFFIIDTFLRSLISAAKGNSLVLAANLAVAAIDT